MTSQTFSDGDLGRTTAFRYVFPQALEIARPNCTRKDVSADGIILTLSKKDRAFINIPVAEVGCRALTFDDLGDRSLPSDHVLIRVTIQKPTSRNQDFCQFRLAFLAFADFQEASAQSQGPFRSAACHPDHVWRQADHRSHSCGQIVASLTRRSGRMPLTGNRSSPYTS